jgi:hypothetical protein
MSQSHDSTEELVHIEGLREALESPEEMVQATSTNRKIEHEGYQRTITSVVETTKKREANETVPDTGISEVLEQVRLAIIESRRIRGRLAQIHRKRKTGMYRKLERTATLALETE